MFIVTTKLNKKKALLIVLAISLILGAVILIAGRRDREGAQLKVESETDILAHLETLGWDVAPEALEIQAVLIPREFSEIFETYNEMQKEAGFDLRDYKGREAVRYTYRVLNHPDQMEGVILDVLVSDGRIIGGDIQSIHQSGFMHGLIARQGA